MGTARAEYGDGDAPTPQPAAGAGAAAISQILPDPTEQADAATQVAAEASAAIADAEQARAIQEAADRAAAERIAADNTAAADARDRAAGGGAYDVVFEAPKLGIRLRGDPGCLPIVDANGSGRSLPATGDTLVAVNGEALDSGTGGEEAYDVAIALVTSLPRPLTLSFLPAAAPASTPVAVAAAPAAAPASAPEMVAAAPAAAVAAVAVRQPPPCGGSPTAPAPKALPAMFGGLSLKKAAAPVAPVPPPAEPAPAPAPAADLVAAPPPTPPPPSPPSPAVVPDPSPAAASAAPPTGPVAAVAVEDAPPPAGAGAAGAAALAALLATFERESAEATDEVKAAHR